MSIRTEDEAEAMTRLIFPLANTSGGVFNYKAPRVASSSLSPEQKAPLLQASITDVFVGLVQQGEQGSSLCVYVAGSVLRLLRCEDTNNPLMQAAVNDASTICTALLALLGPVLEQPGLDALESLQSSRGGSKFLLQEAPFFSCSKQHSNIAALLLFARTWLNGSLRCQSQARPGDK